MVFGAPTSPAGRSLVDHLRQHPPANHRLVMWGVDPDLRTLGWAKVQTAFTKPSTAPPRLEKLWMGVWQPVQCYRDEIEQTNAMIGSLANPEAPWGSSRHRDLPQYVVAEAQRIYPKRDEKPGTVVAKANDLLRLAQISGAFQGLFADATYSRARSFKPDYWKHNAKKAAMHEAMIERVDAEPIVVYLWRDAKQVPYTSLSAASKDLTKAAGREDALDAVCLACFGIDEIMCGRWII